MQPVFIVAQYKCGTSWLLSALAAHPAVVGLREIDIVRAAYEKINGDFQPASTEHRLRGFFGTSAWCRDDPRPALERGEHPDPGPAKLGRPQAYDDLSYEAALGLYAAIKGASNPRAAMDAFLAATGAVADGHSHLVLKAADQIAVFDRLADWQPDAPKLAITRDGRDAAISALHYRRLMASQDAPWYGGDAQYHELLRNWANRAAMLVDRARRGELMLLRYEDLSADFAGTFGRVLEWLGLDASPQRLEKINNRTSFEARTGRSRGTEGTGVIRKGAVGEWREVLTDDEKAEAWKLAGDALAPLGYTETGEPEPFSPQRTE